MLLANMAVAHHITDKFGELAVLRRHPPPQTRMIDELVSCTQRLFVILSFINSVINSLITAVCC